MCAYDVETHLTEMLDGGSATPGLGGPSGHPRTPSQFRRPFPMGQPTPRSSQPARRPPLRQSVDIPLRYDQCYGLDHPRNFIQPPFSRQTSTRKWSQMSRGRSGCPGPARPAPVAGRAETGPASGNSRPAAARAPQTSPLARTPASESKQPRPAARRSAALIAWVRTVIEAPKALGHVSNY